LPATMRCAGCTHSRAVTTSAASTYTPAAVARGARIPDDPDPAPCAACRPRRGAPTGVPPLALSLVSRSSRRRRTAGATTSNASISKASRPFALGRTTWAWVPVPPSGSDRRAVTSADIEDRAARTRPQQQYQTAPQCRNRQQELATSVGSGEWKRRAWGRRGGRRALNFRGDERERPRRRHSTRPTDEYH
jgi:hypothetical protein